MTTPVGWSTQKLAEFLAAVSSFGTEASAALGAVERVAESLDVEVAAVVTHGKVFAATGYPEGKVPIAELDSVARGMRTDLTVPGAGLCPAIVLPLEHPPNASLVVARSGSDALSREEIGLLQGMARVTSMTLRMLRLLDAERALRKESQRQVTENTRLLAALRERQVLLERLASEQAALRRVATLVARAAAPEVLYTAVTAEAGQLLRVDIAIISQYHADNTLTDVGGWNRNGTVLPLAVRVPIGGHNVATMVTQTGRPARIDSCVDASDPLAGVGQAHGVLSAVGAPIIVEGHLWGVMYAGTSLKQPLPPDTEARLADITDLMATAIANAESRTDIAASRVRIVGAADDARRRIERDLHDGAQQRLVSLALDLRAAQATVPSELGQLAAELSRVAEGLRGALDDLREIARGIHPAILAEGGLGSALNTITRRSPIPVQLALRVASRLPERVEVAAYYVVSETLANAAKHAHASAVSVDVEVVDGVLRVCVRDDGVGGVDPSRGSGLVGLKDRVEALGGAITFQSLPGVGTSVRAELPLDD
jgi:signal transduction histidine kinase